MKRLFSIAALLAVALIASSLQATAAPKPHIEDVMADANFINDQGTGDGSFGDFNQAGTSPGTVSDILAVTLSNNAKNLIIDFQTQAAPPAITGIGYRVRANPEGAGHCIIIEAYHPGANNAITQAVGWAVDTCEGGDPVEIKVVGTQWQIPRSASKAFVKGAKLTGLQAQAYLYSGDGSYSHAKYPVADTTKVGTDYTFKK